MRNADAMDKDKAAFDVNLSELNGHVWLGGVSLHENPRRHPAPPQWTAEAWELPAAAVERGEHDDEKRLLFRVCSGSIYDAVADLVALVRGANYQFRDATKKVEQRDAMERSVNRIADALGLSEADATWSSTNDPWERCVEAIEELRLRPSDIDVERQLHRDQQLYARRAGREETT